MNALQNQRNEIRFAHQAAVLIEDHRTEKYYEGKMQNYSTCGMCLHSDFRPESGADIFIGIENSPYSNNYDIVHAKVVWSRRFSRKNTPFNFCMGVNYY